MCRIIFLFCYLFICFIQAEANESQLKATITMQFKKQPLDSALCQLERQSGYQFVYQDKISGKSIKINKKFENKSIAQILDVLLANTDNSYAIYAKWVVIYKKMKHSSKTVLNQKLEAFSIAGTVVDENNGEGLWLVSMFIKGENSKIIPDKDGNFVISTTDPDAEVVVAFPAYIPRVVHVKDAKLIKLKRDPEMWKKIIRFGTDVTDETN
jgi:hypothetical protein